MHSHCTISGNHTTSGGNAVIIEHVPGLRSRNYLCFGASTSATVILSVLHESSQTAWRHPTTCTHSQTCRQPAGHALGKPYHRSAIDTQTLHIRVQPYRFMYHAAWLFSFVMSQVSVLCNPLQEYHHVSACASAACDLSSPSTWSMAPSVCVCVSAACVCLHPALAA